MKKDNDQGFSYFEEAWSNIKVREGSTIVIRVDGKNFSRLLRPYAPFDPDHTEAMAIASIETMKHMMNVWFCYTQSDEASFILTDDVSEKTQPWFGNRIQKISSVSAAAFSVNYSLLMSDYKETLFRGIFDGRVFPLSRPMCIDYIKSRVGNSINNSIISAHTHHIGSVKQMTLLQMARALEEENIFIDPIYKYGTILYRIDSGFARISPHLLAGDDLDHFLAMLYNNMVENAERRRREKSKDN